MARPVGGLDVRSWASARDQAIVWQEAHLWPRISTGRRRASAQRCCFSDSRWQHGSAGSSHVSGCLSRATRSPTDLGGVDPLAEWLAICGIALVPAAAGIDAGTARFTLEQLFLREAESPDSVTSFVAAASENSAELEGLQAYLSLWDQLALALRTDRCWDPYEPGQDP